MLHVFELLYLLVLITLDRSHTVVEFSSSRYIGSESLKGVPVTLLITQGAISARERIVINIVATSHTPVSAEGMHYFRFIVMYRPKLRPKYVCSLHLAVSISRNIPFHNIQLNKTATTPCTKL